MKVIVPVVLEQKSNVFGFINVERDARHFNQFTVRVALRGLGLMLRQTVRAEV